MSPAKQIDVLLSQAFDIALLEVERRARKVLKDHPGTDFCMAMGMASFFDKHGEPLGDELKYLQPFYNFLHKYNRSLHLTGYPMKIERHDGPIIKDW